MSLVFDASDFAALTRSSSCLRCCITDWALAWSCQKSGAFIFSSSAVSCVRAEGSSKIAPHEFDALLELGVARLQVFDVVRRRHGGILADFGGCFSFAVRQPGSTRLALKTNSTVRPARRFGIICAEMNAAVQDNRLLIPIVNENIPPQLYGNLPSFVVNPFDPSETERKIVAFLNDKKQKDAAKLALLALSTLAVALLIFGSKPD